MYYWDSQDGNGEGRGAEKGMRGQAGAGAAHHLVASRDHTPALADDDRALLSTTLRSLRRAIGDRGAAEQLLHGEPHPGNVLSTKTGPLFIDLETGCRGPIEFDLAHVPEEVSDRYPDVDHELLRGG